MSEIAVIGAGPAGLFAAERLAAGGHRVTVYERMPTPGRKLLMAGRGGLNLTHSEPHHTFVTRYGESAGWLAPLIERFPPASLIAWCEQLGQPTFVGSSGRVFPRAMKASPLLRAWLRRLDSHGVTLVTSCRWVGFGERRELIFSRNGGEALRIVPDATVLAVGGASWPRLGSDGGWAPLVADIGAEVAAFEPSNMGILATWSEPMLRHAGAPLKRIAITFAGTRVRGEAIVTRTGLEGGAVYAVSSAVRRALHAAGSSPSVTLEIDLRPDVDPAQLASRLAGADRKASLSNLLRKAAALSPVAIALLREGHGVASLPRDPQGLAAAVKAVPVVIAGVAGLERAISSAGGVMRESLDERLMLRTRPGVFVAGEMLDWEAPTGGYLLQATFATAAMAADGVQSWLAERA